MGTATQVSFSQSIGSISGQGGIEVELEVSYNSNVFDAVTTWNEDSPPTEMALGWALSRSRVLRQPAGTGNWRDDALVIDLDGARFDLSLIDRTVDGLKEERVYKALGSPFLDIRHTMIRTASGEFARDEWNAGNTNGSVRQFGGAIAIDGSGRSDAEGHSIEWQVQWNGWVGESATVWKDAEKRIRAQQQIPLVWNLRRVTSIHGVPVEYAYENDDVAVGGPDGLACTRASYLHAVSITPGQTISLEYAEREPIECPANNEVAKGVCLSQKRYHTKYLAATVVSNNLPWDHGVRTRLVFAYGFDADRPAAPRYLNAEHPTMAKRLLYGAYSFDQDGCMSSPPMAFRYWGEDDADKSGFDVSPTESKVFDGVAGLFGAVKSRTLSSGQRTQYNYGFHSIDSARKSPLQFVSSKVAHDKNVQDEDGVDSRFFAGSDFAVVATLRKYREMSPVLPKKLAQLELRLFDFFSGKWEEVWNSGIIEFGSSLNWDRWERSLRVVPGSGFVVLALDEGVVEKNQPALPSVLYRSRTSVQRWIAGPATPAGIKLGTVFYQADGAWSVSVGDDCFALLDPNLRTVHWSVFRKEVWSTYPVDLKGPVSSHLACMLNGSALYTAVLSEASNRPSLQLAAHFIENGSLRAGWSLTVDDFDAWIGTHNRGVELSSTSNGLACVLYSAKPPASGQNNAWGFAWTQIAVLQGSSAEERPTVQHLTGMDHGKLIEAWFGSDPFPSNPSWSQADPHFVVSAGKDTISIRQDGNLSVFDKGYYAQINYQFDGVAWGAPAGIWSTLDRDESTNFELYGANGLGLEQYFDKRSDGLKFFRINSYDPLTRSWTVEDDISVIGVKAWKQFWQEVADVLSWVSWPLMFSGDLPALVVGAIQAWITVAVGNAAFQISSEVGGNEDNLLLLDNDSTHARLYRRSARDRRYRLAGEVHLAHASRERHLALVGDYLPVVGKGALDTGVITLITTRNGAVTSQVLDDFSELGISGARDIHASPPGPTGVFLTTTTVSDGTASDGLYFCLHCCDQRDAVFGFTDYVVKETIVWDGYQSTHVYFDVTPENAAPESQPVYALASHSALYNKSAHIIGSEALAGSNVEYAFTGRAVPPPFGTGGDADRSPAAVAGETYLQVSLDASRTAVQSTASELAVYESAAGASIARTTRPIETHDMKDGFVSRESFSYEMSVSGMMKRHVQYGEVHGDVQEKLTIENLYAWEVPAYRARMLGKRALELVAQMVITHDGALAWEPTAKVVEDILIGRWKAFGRVAGPRWAACEAPQNMVMSAIPIRLAADATSLVTLFVSGKSALHEQQFVLPFAADNTAPFALPDVLGATLPPGVVTFGSDAAGGVICGIGGIAPGQLALSTIHLAGPNRMFEGLGEMQRFACAGPLLSNRRSVYVADQGFVYTLVFDQPGIDFGIRIPVRIADGWPGATITTSPIAVGPMRQQAVVGVTTEAQGIASGGLCLCQVPGSMVSAILRLEGTPRGRPAVLGIDPVKSIFVMCVDRGSSRFSLAVIEYSTVLIVSSTIDLDFAPQADSLVANASRLWLAGEDNRIRSYAIANGKIDRVWTDVSLPGPLAGAMHASEDGTLYAAFTSAQSGGCVSIFADGTIEWRYDAPGVAMEPADIDGTVMLPIATTEAGDVVRLNLVELAQHSDRITAIRSSVTEWDDDINPVSNFVYDGSGSVGFDFEAGAANKGWNRSGRSKWQAGLCVESEDTVGVPDSTLYGPQYIGEVAHFSGASIERGEAFFHSFEIYESDRFVLAGGASISDVDSFMGQRCLLLPINAAASARPPQSPLATPIGDVMLTALVKGGALIRDDVIGLTLSKAGSPPRTLHAELNREPMGSWTQLSGVVSLKGLDVVGCQVSLVLKNAGGAPVLVDHCWYSPLGCGLTAFANDPVTYLPIAATSQNGGVSRTVYTSELSEFSKTDTGNRVNSMAAKYDSRALELGSQFQPKVPNSHLSLLSRGGGDLWTFRTSEDTRPWELAGAHWTAAGIEIPSGGAMHLASASAHPTYGVRVQVPNLRDDSFKCDFVVGIQSFSLRIVADGSSLSVSFAAAGQAFVTLGPVPRTDDLLLFQVSDEKSPGDSQACTVYAYVGSRRVVNDVAMVPATANKDAAISVHASNGPLRVRYVSTISDMKVSETYADGDLQGRQIQAHESQSQVVVAGEVVFDAAKRPRFSTVQVRKHPDARAIAPRTLAFEPDFVSQRDPAGGGKLWSTDPADDSRGRMEGLVQSWARMDSPDLEADQSFFHYDGSYDAADPLARWREQTSSSSAARTSTPQTTLHEEGPTAQTRPLIDQGGLTASSDYRWITKKTPRNEESRFSATSAVGRLDRPGLSAFGEGSAPFAPAPAKDLKFLLSSNRYRFRTNGDVLDEAMMPNFYHVPSEQTDHTRFVMRTEKNAYGHTISTTNPDAGRSDAVNTLSGVLLFAQDANGKAGNYFTVILRDRLARNVASGIVQGIHWTPARLDELARLRPGWEGVDLVGDWPLNQSSGAQSVDLSGNQLTATTRQSDGWMLNSPNRMGRSLRTGMATLNYAAAGPNALLDLAGVISVCAWFCALDEIPAQARATVLAANSGLAGDHLQVNLERGRISVSYALAGVSKELEVQRPVAIGEWIHFSLTANHDGWALYVNGELAAEMRDAPAPSLKQVTWTAGAAVSAGTPRSLFNGAIAGWRIYRRALSAPEAYGLYILGLFRPFSETRFDSLDNQVSLTGNGYVVEQTAYNTPLALDLIPAIAAFHACEGPGSLDTHVSDAQGTTAVRLPGHVNWRSDHPSGSGWTLASLSASAMPIAVVRIRPSLWASPGPAKGWSLVLWFRLLDADSEGVLVSLADEEREWASVGIRPSGLSLDSRQGSAALPCGAKDWHHLSLQYRATDNKLSMSVDAGRSASVELPFESELPGTLDAKLGLGVTCALSSVRLFPEVLNAMSVESLYRREALPGRNPVIQHFTYDRDGNMNSESILVSEFDAIERTTRFQRNNLGEIVRIDYPTN